MLYYNFKDYSEFKELFGIQKHENGTKSRKNKLILSYIKNQKNKTFITGHLPWHRSSYQNSIITNPIKIRNHEIIKKPI